MKGTGARLRTPSFGISSSITRVGRPVRVDCALCHIVRGICELTRRRRAGIPRLGCLSCYRLRLCGVGAGPSLMAVQDVSGQSCSWVCNSLRERTVEAKSRGLTFQTNALKPWRLLGEVRRSPEYLVHYYPFLLLLQRSGKKNVSRSQKTGRITHYVNITR